MKSLLKEERIQYESIKTYATPRRLTLIIEGLYDKQETLELKVKGPTKKLPMIIKVIQVRLYKVL